MKIAFIGLLARYPASRGTPLRIQEMARGVAAAGHEVSLICMEADPVPQDGVTYIPLKLGKRWLYSTAWLFLLPSLLYMCRKLRGILKALRPDVAHVHTHTALLLSILPLKLLGIPIVFDAHSNFMEELVIVYGRETLDVKLWRLFEGWLVRRANAVTAVSRALADYFVAKGVPPGRVFRVPGGVGRDFTAAEAPGGAKRAGDGKTTTVMYTGNFYAWQGTDLLMEAARLIATERDDIKFAFIGDDRDGGFRRRVADAGAAGYVMVSGPVGREEMPSVLHGADILVLPRPDSLVGRYGFPSKLPEYLASGRPVVATDVGDHGLLVKDGETGLLVPPDGPAIARAILRLAGDRKLRERLGTAGRELAVGDYAWEVLAARIEDIYRMVIKTGYIA